MKKIVVVFLAISGVVGFFVVKNSMAYFDIPFALKTIDIRGIQYIDKQRVIKTAELAYGNNILSYNPSSIKNKLEKLGEIKSAIVARCFPSTFVISIQERIPIAFWRGKNSVLCVDNEGTLFTTKSVYKAMKLPLILGDGAPKQFPHLMRCLNKYPAIKSQIIFCHLISNRRWNIQMNNDILIKLPEDGLYQAIAYLSTICNSRGQINPELSVVDLRFSDKVIFRKKQPEAPVSKRKKNEI